MSIDFAAEIPCIVKTFIVMVFMVSLCVVDLVFVSVIAMYIDLSV